MSWRATSVRVHPDLRRRNSVSLDAHASIPVTLSLLRRTASASRPVIRLPYYARWTTCVQMGRARCPNALRKTGPWVPAPTSPLGARKFNRPRGSMRCAAEGGVVAGDRRNNSREHEQRQVAPPSEKPPT